jgi:hypothetical protein
MKILSARTFTGFFLVSALLFAAVLPAVNWLTDTARTLHPDGRYYVRPLIYPNMRCIAVEHILRHNDQSTRLIAGSSRVWAGLDPRVLGDGWARLAYTGGRVYEHLQNLETIKARGGRVREVLVALDDASLYTRSVNDNDYILRQPPATLAQRVDFLRFYLFRTPTRQDLALPLRGVLSEKGWYETNGLHDTNLQPGRVLEMCPYSWKWPREKTQLPWLLADAKRLAARHNGRFFFLPVHYKTLLYRNVDDMYVEAALLARLGGYRDFRPLTLPQALDNAYWSETSHFTKHLGDIILQALRNGDTSWGQRVDTMNFEQSFARLIDSVYAALPELLRRDTMIRLNQTLLGPAPVFTLRDASGVSNVRGWRKQGERFTFESDGAPIFAIPQTGWTGKAVLKVRMEVPRPLVCTLEEKSRAVYSRRLETMESMRLAEKRLNTELLSFFPESIQEFYIPLDNPTPGKALQLRLEGAPGQYVLHELSIWPLGRWTPPRLDRYMADFALSTEKVLSSGIWPVSNIWDVIGRTSGRVERLAGQNELSSRSGPPELTLNLAAPPLGRDYVLMLEMPVAEDTPVQVSWSGGAKAKGSASAVLRAGDKEQRVFLRIPGGGDGHLRLRLGATGGSYKILNLEVRAVAKTSGWAQ